MYVVCIFARDPTSIYMCVCVYVCVCVCMYTIKYITTDVYMYITARM